MKKNFTLFFVLLCLSVTVFGQSPVVWKNAVFDKGNSVSDIHKDNSGNIYACVIEHGPMNVIKSIFVNKFSPELDFISKVELEGDLPKLCEIQFVLDYICVLSNESVLSFYDYSGSLVKKFVLDKDYQYSIISGNWATIAFRSNFTSYKTSTNITESNDLNNITIWGYKKTGNPKNQLDKNHSIKVYAYNSKLVSIAEESFGFEEVFSNSADINTLQFDVTPKSKLVALCSNESKPDQAKVYLAVFNESDKSPVVHKYSFKYEVATFAYDFGKMNEIFISGVISVGGLRPSFKRTDDKTLYFINQSLTDTKAATPVIYSLEDQIYNAYPEYTSKLKINSLNPFGLFVMEDGILFGAMEIKKTTSTSTTVSGNGMSSSSSSTYYYSKCLSFIKFSFTGKIQWLKMIPKEVKIADGYEKIGGIAYAHDANKLRVIYCDNPANILNKSKKMVYGSTLKTVPAYAEISSGGDITIKPLDKFAKKKMMCYPGESELVDNNIILLSAKIKGMFSMDYFLGKTPLP